MAWTQQQQVAIETRGCGLVVSAAAGSGKTSVLVERLLQILMEERPEYRVPADRIIVVTFTNDAAAEMRSRLYQALDFQLQKQPENRWLYQQQILLQSAHICTISSFCFELIRDNLTDHGITSGFRVLDTTESDMIAAKAADRVLDRWHKTREEDITLLWDSFCERNDKPLEELVLELHRFLGAVPFRDIWCEEVLSNLQLPLEESPYHLALLGEVQQKLGMALFFAEKALELSEDLYESMEDNKVYSWIDADITAMQAFSQQLKNHAEPKQILAPILELKTNRGKASFPRKNKKMLDPEAFEKIKSFRKDYEKLRDEVCTVVETLFPYEETDLQQQYHLSQLLFSLEEELSEEIWQEKIRQNALGFDDGERLALELLSDRDADGTIRPSSLAQELQTYYELIMIDEYQDSNNKQDDIFKLLSRNCIDPETGALRYGENVFLVGDVKQSIYRFRLANPQNFVGAIADAEQKKGVCQHIALNRNFRSVPEILRFVNFLCGNLMSDSCGDVEYSESEALVPGTAMDEKLPEDARGVQIAILSQEAAEDIDDVQQEFVVRQIKKMIQERTPVLEKDGSLRPCCYGDFCVLMRSNDKCSDFAHALENAGIPVQSPEEKGYLQSREISALLDMLRVVDNPLLDTSLAAVMLSPMFWFSPEELTKIRMIDKSSSLYAVLCQAIGVMPKKPDSVSVMLEETTLQKCQNLYDTIQELRQESAVLSLEGLIRKIYDTTDFLSIMQLTKDGDRKRANLQLLLQYAKQYEENSVAAHSGVSGFLRYIDWLTESGKDFQQTQLVTSGENAVAVKTMHRSKGLEYPFVFLGKLETGFSKADTQKSALFSDKGLVGYCIKDPKTYVRAKTTAFTVLDQENRRFSKSEELRLFYVAMTRARQKLFLSLDVDKTQNSKGDQLAKYATGFSPEGTLPSFLVQSANSMAKWVWMCLVLKHDDGLAACRVLPKKHWKAPAWSEQVKIQYQRDLPTLSASCDSKALQLATPDAATVRQLRELSAFQYDNADVQRESLLSVSAIQETIKQRVPVWNRPKFMQETVKLTGAERGTAIHTFFQYANFEAAQQGIDEEIARLCRHGYLTDAQASVIAPDLIQTFFQNGLYQRLSNSKRVLREQKFQIQCKDLSGDPDARKILMQYENSDSLLQGKIDLAFQEEDAFVLVDYKTDSVSDPGVLVESYREQVTLYRIALQCITGLPVKQCYLYSTHLGREIEITGGNDSDDESYR